MLRKRTVLRLQWNGHADSPVMGSPSTERRSPTVGQIGGTARSYPVGLRVAAARLWASALSARPVFLCSSATLGWTSGHAAECVRHVGRCGHVLVPGAMMPVRRQLRIRCGSGEPGQLRALGGDLDLQRPAVPGVERRVVHRARGEHEHRIALRTEGNSVPRPGCRHPYRQGTAGLRT
jgi:hypothetical protein